MDSTNIGGIVCRWRPSRWSQWSSLILAAALIGGCKRQDAQPPPTAPTTATAAVPTTTPATTPSAGVVSIGVSSAATGNFEAIDCNGMVGWVWDPTQPDVAISIEILDGTTVIGTAKADEFRQDLLNAKIGNGKHG